MNVAYTPDDYSLNSLITFSSKLLNFHTNSNDLEVEMYKFFPTLSFDELDESWLFSITNKLLELSEEEQKIVFRVLDVASEYYYNLLDILNSKYKPHSEYREKCSEILFHGQTGRFYLINDEGRFNLWKANLSKSD